MKRLLLTTIVALLAFAGSAQAKTPAFYVPRPHHACRAHYVKRTVKIHRHGKTVRQVRCVHVKPKPKPAAPAPAPAPSPAPTPVAAPAPAPVAAPMPVGANIDPTFTQDPADNLRVTWSYNATAAAAILPGGTLSLTVQELGHAGNSGGCVINVGGNTKGGSCTLELPRYGLWQVAVTFTGQSANVTPSTSTETADIEPLPLAISRTWGTDAPTQNPAVSATVAGKTATTTVTDADFEGASSVTLTDNLGDGCQATVSGTTATCAMPVTGTPASYTIAYPGGVSTKTTQPAPPNGIQQVTTAWPAENVPVANPTVTVQQATVEECGATVPKQENDYGTCSYGSPTNWLNPISITTTTHISLFAVAFGSLASDRDPTHGGGLVSGYLTYTVTGGTAGVDYTATDQQSNFDGSADCSKVTTQQYLGGDPSNPASYGPDEPFGGCALVFQTPGQYTVRVTYTSEDANYPNAAGPSETISVG